MLLHDEALVEQVKKGSHEAFSQLVRRHQSTVFSICYRMVGDAGEAEDLAQEAFLRLYRSAHSFRPGSSLKPWLHRIVANVCLDALRGRSRAELLPIEGLDHRGEQPAVYSRDELPEDAYLARETQHRVQSALLELPGEYRVVLVLRYLEDLSYREIAAVLDVPVTTVETRIFRGKKVLARILALQRETGEEVRHELRLERRTGL